MPGIVGIISKRPREECRCLVRSMVASMEHEAFYISGAHFVPEMGIYAGWVAHEDSFAAGQVFFNEQQDIALIFSGECFVDRQIRDDLRQKGHRFESNDGALLVHLYEEEGNRFFEKLNGLFSGLLIDKRLKNAFLFNDRYGVERIYWHETRDAIYFASEAKALLRVLPELRTFDEEGVAEFLTFGCALESRTLFRNINVLPGASLWSFENGKCYKRKYFSAETWESQPTLSTESFTSQFRETFKRILPRYFDSDSRIGISLTAGLDGRMIMACRPDTAEAPVCYTFCGQNQQTLDAQLAAHVAEACGLEHQILRIGRDFFSNFALHADRTVYITDGCLGISGAHEIYLNGEARQIAPVRLTGVFGGEILRGVSMFKPIRLSPRLVNPDIGQSLSCFAQERKGNSQHPVTFAAFCEIPEKRFGPPAASRSQVTFRTPYLDNEIVALAYQIPESLRMSAIPALELIESNDPVLNNIPTDMGQIGEIRGIAAALRRFFSKATFKLDYLHNEGLPHWFSPLDPVFTRVASGLKIVGLHKYLHYRSWFRKELAEYVSEILSDSRIQQNPLWNSDFLGSMASEHIRGRKNYVLELDAVMTLEAVERLLFRDLCRESKPVAALATSAAIAVAPARHITPVKNEAQN
jgi:asparagine synthase (glutamine-hydrolysing)